MSDRTVIVGLPGSGKSTVGRAVAAAIHGEFLEERPEQFEFLEDAFRDPARYAALGQIEFLVKKANAETASGRGPIVQEIDTRYCHGVWSYGLRRTGRITGREFRVLCETADVLRVACPTPERIVALDVGWDEILARLRGRALREDGRRAELAPDFLTLLKELSVLHSAWIEAAMRASVPCMRIDASDGVGTIVAEVVAFASP